MVHRATLGSDPEKLVVNVTSTMDEEITRQERPWKSVDLMHDPSQLGRLYEGLPVKTCVPLRVERFVQLEWVQLANMHVDRDVVGACERLFWICGERRQQGEQGQHGSTDAVAGGPLPLSLPLARAARGSRLCEQTSCSDEAGKRC